MKKFFSMFIILLVALFIMDVIYQANNTQTVLLSGKIMGFEKVYIENHKGILEYEEYFIRLNTYIGIININGFNLKLDEMTTDDILVTGKIDSIDFENTIDNENEEE